MSTQGLVVVKRNSTVVLKIHAFCNGQHADKLEENLLQLQDIPSPEAVWGIAIESGFGAKNGMTVVVHKDGYYRDQGLHDADWLFRELASNFEIASYIPPLEYAFMTIVRFKN